MASAPPLPRRPPPLPVCAAATGGAAALLLVLVTAGWAPLASFDQELAGTTHRWALDHPTLTHTHRVLSDWVWDPWTMRLLAAAAVIRLWTGGRRLPALCFAVTCVLGTVLQQILKAAVNRDRPQWTDPVDSAQYQAFPSGHAMTVVVTLGLCLWALRLYEVRGPVWWAAVAGAAVSALGVGWTRVWLGVHWPTDVMGGWLLGALAVLVAVLVHGRVRETCGKPRPA
ncbi:undecaprenyl pyrophosphate phosphatase [Streptomyces sp. YIM 130001]|uniref:phosphatase PAP2 family protein n=1 Tax=Streptomyces sp. YIM 130001 TaxID=2259644 RepID=UPI000E645FE7|nr:phosphatase PAP2 family protein [Streptomyces sp. YIM 130001]RII09315.1 undecaprenyl pyrophosphate phosphatase [Streptomyces sp. YIM 130001]